MNEHAHRGGLRRLFRRTPWVNATTALIALGTLMLLQPFAMTLYTYSFLVIVTGTVGYLVVSHFPED